MRTLLLLFFSLMLSWRSQAQSQELEQLRLDLEKLAQFKLMLSEMKSGYQTLMNGYNCVRDAGKSNFSLHQNYLDGLLQVKPALTTSPAVQRIYQRQDQFVSIIKTYTSRFTAAGVFTASELQELQQVFSDLSVSISANTTLLQTVLSPGRLRMSDGERASVINTVDAAVQKDLSRLNTICQEYQKAMVNRQQIQRDHIAIKRLSAKN